MYESSLNTIVENVENMNLSLERLVYFNSLYTSFLAAIIVLFILYSAIKKFL